MEDETKVDVDSTQESAATTTQAEAEPEVFLEDEKEKVGFFKKIADSKMIKDLGKGTKFLTGKAVEAANFVGEKLDAFAEKQSLIKEANELFEKMARAFRIDNREVSAIRKLDDNFLTFRFSDIAEIGAGTELRFDNIVLEITDIDRKSTFDFIFEDKTYPLPCVQAVIRVKEKIPQANSTINQNITLGDHASCGDITLTAQISAQLDTIEQAIKDYKPGLLHKGKKDQAQQLFASYKNCVIGQQPKDKAVFDKFIAVLQVILPSVVALATSLWLA